MYREDLASSGCEVSPASGLDGPVMRVIFLGSPGSGKGTQSELLCKRNGLAYLGTGAILRVAMDNHTPLGERARPFVESGRFAPDELVDQVVAEFFSQPDRPERFVL